MAQSQSMKHAQITSSFMRVARTVVPTHRFMYCCLSFRILLLLLATLPPLGTVVPLHLASLHSIKSDSRLPAQFQKLGGIQIHPKHADKCSELFLWLTWDMSPLLVLHAIAASPLWWNKNFPKTFVFGVPGWELLNSGVGTDHHKGRKAEAVLTVWLESFLPKEKFSSQILVPREQWELFRTIWEMNLVAEYTRDGWFLQQKFYCCSEESGNHWTRNTFPETVMQGNSAVTSHHASQILSSLCFA